LALLLWLAAALLLLLLPPTAAQPPQDDASGSPLREIPEVSIKILRKSGPSCKPEDQEEIRGRLTEWGNEFPGVDTYSTFVQPLGRPQEVGRSCTHTAYTFSSNGPAAAEFKSTLGLLAVPPPSWGSCVCLEPHATCSKWDRSSMQQQDNRITPV
jgi:hypothetical protein